MKFPNSLKYQQALLKQESSKKNKGVKSVGVPSVIWMHNKPFLLLIKVKIMQNINDTIKPAIFSMIISFKSVTYFKKDNTSVYLVS